MITAPAGAAQASKRYPYVPALALTTVILSLGYRLYRLIRNDAVNLIYYDQWDFLGAFFDGNPSFVRLFLWQHGPHREGVGLIPDKFLYPLTHWNSRAESFMIGGIVFCAMLLALWLKRKLFGGLSGPDAVIPLAFLTLMQYETFLGAINPAYSAFPLLLVVIYCLALLQRRPLVRYGLVLVINFLLIYTGLGIFMGAVTIGVFALLSYRCLRGLSSDPLAYPATGLVVAAASLGSFFIHYVPVPAAESCAVPYSAPADYFRFMALMFATYLGPTRPVAWIAAGGGIAVLTVVAVFGFQIYQLARSNGSRDTHLVIAVLLGYVLLLSAMTAVGRVCRGLPEAAQTSRYTTLLIPAFLGLYLFLLTLPSPAKRRITIGLLLILLLPGAITYPAGARRFSEGKRAWAACFVHTGDVGFCDRSTGFEIFPESRRTHVEQKLTYLKAHRLNLFSE